MSVPDAKGLGQRRSTSAQRGRDSATACSCSMPRAATTCSRTSRTCPTADQWRAWVTLWDNLLEGRSRRRVLSMTAMRALPRETDEQNAQRMLGYLARRSGDSSRRTSGRGAAVRRRGACARSRACADTQSQKAAWFNAYRDVVLTPTARVARTRVAA